jgi:hypothetical protein
MLGKVRLNRSTRGALKDLANPRVARAAWDEATKVVRRERAEKQRRVIAVVVGRVARSGGSAA